MKKEIKRKAKKKLKVKPIVVKVKEKIKRKKKKVLSVVPIDIQKVNVIDKEVANKIEEQCKDCKAYKKGALPYVLLHLAEGHPIVSACKGAGIDVVTLWRWRQKYSIIDEIIKICLHGRNMVVEDSLYNQAIKGNIAAIVFYLCNRAKEDWVNVQKVEGNIKVGIEVTAIRDKMLNEQKPEEQKKLTEGKKE